MTKTNNWTPGPWHRDATSGMTCDVRSASGRAVACTYGVAPQPKDAEAIARQRAMDDANAHLIVAAPEMYDALEASRLWFEHNGFTMPPCYEMTLRALAKAKRVERGAKSQTCRR